MDESPTNFEPGNIICWPCTSVSNETQLTFWIVNRTQTESLIADFKRYVLIRYQLGSSVLGSKSAKLKLDRTLRILVVGGQVLENCPNVATFNSLSTLSFSCTLNHVSRKS